MSSSSLPPVANQQHRPLRDQTELRVGAPKTFGAKTSRAKRQEKLNMWSAVALQQHFALSGGVQALTATSRTAAATAGPHGERHSERTPMESLPAAILRPGPCSSSPSTTAGAKCGRSSVVLSEGNSGKSRWTLAQKMKLVPAPPPAPTEDDWHAAETRAMLRAQHEYEDVRRAAGCSATPSTTSASFSAFAMQVCSICRDPFYYAAHASNTASRHQGLVILSCSHVFHENCFRQFERLVRRQQRDEVAAGAFSGDQTLGVLMTRLACPECRSTNYHKRTYFAGPAMAERAALVRIQAAARGFLTRRHWRAIRLRANPAYRESFVESRLARLARAWEECLARQAQQREALLLSLDVQRQEAAAAFLSESEWQDIIRKRVEMTSDGGVTGGDLAAARPNLDTSVSACFSCVICLERVQRGLRPSQALLPPRKQLTCTPSTSSIRQTPPTPPPLDVHELGADRHDAVIAEMRANYEKRRAEGQPKSKQSVASKGKRAAITAMSLSSHRSSTGIKSTPASAGPTRPSANQCTQPPSTKSECKSEGIVASCTTASPPGVVGTRNNAEPSNPAPAPRYGVILSCCGQVFHEACLTAFERYAERTAAVTDTSTARSSAAAPTVTAPPRRCPLCRSGYGKHAF